MVHMRKQLPLRPALRAEHGIGSASFRSPQVQATADITLPRGRRWAVDANLR